MTPTRTSALTLLLCSALALGAHDAQAGFEFSGATQQPASAVQTSSRAAPSGASSAPAAEIGTPMPITPVDRDMLAVPSAAVDGMMAPPPSQLTGPVHALGPVPEQVDPNEITGNIIGRKNTSPVPPAAAAPVPSGPDDGEEVYIRRQREVSKFSVPMKPGSGDASALGRPGPSPVAAESEQARELIAATAGEDMADDTALVINPYPLQNDDAVHDGTSVNTPLEKAMMEQSGNLRPIAFPGSNTAAGARARTRVSSRYDVKENGIGILSRSDNTGRTVSMSGSSNITPIPGGEGAPLPNFGAMPVESAALPEPLMPSQAMGAPTNIVPSYNTASNTRVFSNADETGVTPAGLAGQPQQAHMVPNGPDAGAPSSAQAMTAMPPAPVRDDAVLPTAGRVVADTRPKPALVEGSLAAAPKPAQEFETGNAAPAATAANGAYAEAVGFGRDMPLPLALSQVVPPGYSYAFGPGVDTGVTVSWQGGKPWNVVLDDMLTQAGLKANIGGRSVSINSAS